MAEDQNLMFSPRRKDAKKSTFYKSLLGAFAPWRENGFSL
jgi:hypothetical protein